MERNEESVLSAIKDLQDLEARRCKDEEAARALREAAEAEARERVRVQAEAARAEQARRAADEAAGEAARRDQEASQRMERLRAELAAVQADRQRLQERILDPVTASAIPASSPYRRGAMALTASVRPQADGTTRVAFDQSGAADPELVQRVVADYNRRMGR